MTEIVEPVTPAEEPPSANAEAAKWRTKLRETETRLEAAEARTAALLRKAVVGRVADRLAEPEDLFSLGGAELTALINADDDSVNGEALDEAVADLLAKRPGLAATPEPAWGDVGQGSRGAVPAAEPTMGDAFRAMRR
ncbi:hypothetical protein PV394_16190 [Streptomyces sp. NE06-03E]|uniref:hypothetical protein n=1 Tax=Streptomyces sp. NE06-03E TaxID=3028695 RepID=UPI0029BD735F|nr:hypothetical protein [Streptomyces sp. NE06-03E]MDX3056668.1 hypothetical protein [Streptomyces sp. NE06-03E]